MTLRFLAVLKNPLGLARVLKLPGIVERNRPVFQSLQPRFFSPAATLGMNRSAPETTITKPSMGDTDFLPKLANCIALCRF